MAEESLIVRGAREHNLRNIDVTIPRDRLTVITGLSGSGKSSLAFDTIYAEGQRRYVESLSAYARQFLGLMEKPDVDSIEGLSPAISIEQKTAGHNPRSTVGTVTEIYDYLRLLYARAGTPHCPNCGRAGAAAERRRRSPTSSSPGRRTRDRGPRAARAGTQGRVPRAVRDGAQAGLRPRVRRRRADRGRGSAEAQPPAEPQRSRSSSIASSCAPRIAAASPTRIETALKLADGLVEVVRRRARDARETVLRALRLPDVRHLAARARAAALLVQLAVRRLPACGGLGTRRRVSEELILGDPQHLDSRRRDPAVGRAERLSAQGRPAGARAAVQVRSQRAVGRPAEVGARLHALRRQDAAKGTAKKSDDGSRVGRRARNIERRYDEIGLRHRCAWSSRSS